MPLEATYPGHSSVSFLLGNQSAAVTQAAQIETDESTTLYPETLIEPSGMGPQESACFIKPHGDFNHQPDLGADTLRNLN